MITRDQVKDLQAGDVVEYSGHRDLRGARLIGPLSERGGLYIADYVVRDSTGKPPPGGTWGDPVLTVVSRPPRPLYVNHPRTEPAPGDVVRDADDQPGRVWMYTRPVVKRPWVHTSDNHLAPDEMPNRLVLLVDGETGQVVQ